MLSPSSPLVSTTSVMLVPAATLVLAAAVCLVSCETLTASLGSVPSSTLVIFWLPALIPLSLILTGPAVSVSVVTFLKVTSGVVATLIEPLSFVSAMLSPALKLAILLSLSSVLTVAPSIWVTTSCRALSPAFSLALVASLRSTL